jgi:hypothetical protein
MAHPPTRRGQHGRHRPVDAIITRRPELGRTRSRIRDFGEMVTDLTGKNLAAWLARVEREGEPELRNFTKGVRRDLAAVSAGLTCPTAAGPSKATSTASR